MHIHDAAAQGDIAGVVQALASGIAVDTREPHHGHTPLMTAAASPHAGSTIVAYLLERGADVNARSWTPETAVQAGVVARSTPDASYQFTGDTALTLAAATGDLAVVRCLLDAGADVDATTTTGYSALLNAVYSGARRPQGAAALVTLLLERGAAPSRASSYGETPLAVAAHSADFTTVRLLLAAGVDTTSLGWTPLMHAVVFGDLATVRAHLADGAALETADAWGRTALQLSLELGDPEKVAILLAAGAQLDPDLDLTPLIGTNPPAILAWLMANARDPEGTNRFGQTPLAEAVATSDVDAVRLLLAAGARADRTDAYGEPLIASAHDLRIVRLLLAHGADLNAVNDEMRVALFGIERGAPLELPRAVYLAGKARRFGTANPEVMAVPFWQAMVRSRVAGYEARRHFGDTESYDTMVWCFARFGRTLTALPDGRYVEIAGEHEDFYDPDFCIYNDVVVYDGAGGFTVYGYPEAVFPPTDFHTATLVGASIYVIGSVGYHGARSPGATPVYRLGVADWRIEPVATRGELPGWISRHTATYDTVKHQIVVRGGQRYEVDERWVDNEAVHALDLTTLWWRRVED